MNATSIKDLYMSELKDLLSAEQQLVRALPGLARGARTPQLAEAFESHLAETRGHVQRLEEVLAGLGVDPGGERCAAMTGLIQEGQEILAAGGEDAVRDVGIIVAAQKVEHYEIAGYGCVCAIARLLGRTDDARVLEQTLDEGKRADATLTEVAMRHVNAAAAI
jgi:ferritin-like metal-binding protein YciE